MRTPTSISPARALRAAAAGALVCSAALAPAAGAYTFTVEGSSVQVPTQGTANPYPATKSVSGITRTITDVRAALTLTHSFPDDLDVLLVGPTGQKTLLMSDAGGDPN